jgi:cell division protein FtsB
LIMTAAMTYECGDCRSLYRQKNVEKAMWAHIQDLHKEIAELKQANDVLKDEVYDLLD